MKCSYHPDVDATGVCVNCGRMVCRDCALTLQGRVYCQPCADELVVARPAVKPKTDRSGLLTAGGILSIVSGAISILYSLFFILPFLMILLFSSETSAPEDDWDLWFPLIFLTPFTLAFTVLGVMAIIGGIQALKRKRFGLALGGAICGSVFMQVFGIPAVIFIALSKDEFKKKTTRTEHLS